MSLVKELRDAAMKDHRPSMRNELRAIAVRLERSMEELRNDINEDTLAQTNGLWARALKVLDAASEPEDPAPISGFAVEPQMRMAA